MKFNNCFSIDINMFSGPESSTTVPAFVAKLWQMVSDKKYDELISWCDNGLSFVIKDQSRFCSELLPMYYKHNNMASFIRQLNKYGFRKVASVNSASLKGDVSDFEFCHPNFVCGCPGLLEQIKRKVSTSRDITEYKNDQGILTKLLLEVQQLQQKQSVFENRITAMKAENDALWREHSILRQKHQKQQKIVNRLIHFLLSLVHQTRGVNVKRRNMPLMLKDGTCLSIEGLMPTKERHYGTTSPVICELDPSDTFLITETENKPHNIGNLDIIIQGQTGNNSDAVKSQFQNTDNVLLESPSPAIALPQHEGVASSILDPNIVQNITEDVPKNSVAINRPVSKLPEKRSIGWSNNKRIVKVMKTPPAIQSISQPKLLASSSNTDSQFLNPKVATNKKIGTPRVTLNKKSHVKMAGKKSTKNKKDSNINSLQNSDIQDNNTVKKQDPPLELEPDVNIFNNDDYTSEEQSNLLSSNPIIFSPSGTQILSPEFVEDSEKEENPNTSLVLSDSVFTKQEAENHIDLMQSDLDVLKEILHGDGLSLDASTIMGLFGGDDPILLNMPEAGRSIDDLNLSPTGNELVSYTPNLIDIADGLDEDDLPATNVSSLIDEISSLNTPQATPATIDFPRPSPSKRLKK